MRSQENCKGILPLHHSFPGRLPTRRATRLSGGEAQWVALARALVLEPQLLLLDEPFRSLDRSAHARLVADLTVLLTATVMTTVFSSNSEGDVRKLADRQVELEGGRIRLALD